MKRLLTSLAWASIVCAQIFSPVVIAAENLRAVEDVVEPEKGPHRGRLLQDGGFAIELAIFETGVPPEYRVWVTNDGRPVAVNEVALNVVLARLGGVKDTIAFTPQAEFLRGDKEIYEPHSFSVTVKAHYQGKSYQWEFDNFEGRTRIENDVAAALHIETAIAGPMVLKESIQAYGKLAFDPAYTREISARFEGAIKNINVNLGQHVAAGQPIITIESNESLKSYTLAAPIDGVVTQRNANPSEQSNGRTLLTIVNNEKLVADLALFPSQRHQVAVGAIVWLTVIGEARPIRGVIQHINPFSLPNQAIIARAQLNNEDGRLVAGSFVDAQIEVAEHPVPLAVKRSGLQKFRDFTVVFAKISDEYEVRMLELGRVAGEWVEVLGGLQPGTEYVTENSYVIKADIEKSGASHDH